MNFAILYIGIPAAIIAYGLGWIGVAHIAFALSGGSTAGACLILAGACLVVAHVLLKKK